MKLHSSLVLIITFAAGCHGSYVVSSASKTTLVSSTTKSFAASTTSGSNANTAPGQAFSNSNPSMSTILRSVNQETVSKGYNAPISSKTSVSKVAVAQKPAYTPCSTLTSSGASSVTINSNEVIKKSDSRNGLPGYNFAGVEKEVVILQKNPASEISLGKIETKKHSSDSEKRHHGYYHKIGKTNHGSKKV